MRDSFIYYRSFDEAIDELPDNEQFIMEKAIRKYGLECVEPTLDSPYLRAIWKCIKPQLDANWRKYENGSKGAEYGKRGGRPKKGISGKPQENPTRTPPEPPM